MSYIEATLRDYWRKKRKQEFDPISAFKHHVKSSDSTSIHNPHYEPIDSLVTDPVIQQARAEEAFYSQQHKSGHEVFQRGQLETAADEQNLRIFEESRQDGYGANSEPGYLDPMQDPRASGYPSIYQMPKADPMAMPPVGRDPLSMFLGGY